MAKGKSNRRQRARSDRVPSNIASSERNSEPATNTSHVRNVTSTDVTEKSREVTNREAAEQRLRARIKQKAFHRTTKSERSIKTEQPQVKTAQTPSDFFTMRAALAAWTGDVETMKMMMMLRMHPSTRSPMSEPFLGRPLLHLAAAQGHAEMVQFLASAGASVDDTSNTPMAHTPLTAAAEAGHVEVCKTLLANRADPDGGDGNYESPALHWAVDREDHLLAIKLVKVLVEGHANVKAINHEGRSVLHFVRHPLVAEFLVSLGADVHASTMNCVTPFCLMVERALESQNNESNEAKLQASSIWEIAEVFGKHGAISADGAKDVALYYHYNHDRLGDAQFKQALESRWPDFSIDYTFGESLSQDNFEQAIRNGISSVVAHGLLSMTDENSSINPNGMIDNKRTTYYILTESQNLSIASFFGMGVYVDFETKSLTGPEDSEACTIMHVIAERLWKYGCPASRCMLTGIFHQRKAESLYAIPDAQGRTPWLRALSLHRNLSEHYAQLCGQILVNPAIARQKDPNTKANILHELLRPERVWEPGSGTLADAVTACCVRSGDVDGLAGYQKDQTKLSCLQRLVLLSSRQYSKCTEQLKEIYSHRAKRDEEAHAKLEYGISCIKKDLEREEDKETIENILDTAWRNPSETKLEAILANNSMQAKSAVLREFAQACDIVCSNSSDVQALVSLPGLTKWDDVAQLQSALDELRYEQLMPIASNCSPLQLAIECASWGVPTMLRAWPAYDLTNEHNETLFHYVIRKQNPELLLAMLEQFQALPVRKLQTFFPKLGTITDREGFTIEQRIIQLIPNTTEENANEGETDDKATIGLKIWRGIIKSTSGEGLQTELQADTGKIEMKPAEQNLNKKRKRKRKRQRKAKVPDTVPAKQQGQISADDAASTDRNYNQSSTKSHDESSCTNVDKMEPIPTDEHSNHNSQETKQRFVKNAAIEPVSVEVVGQNPVQQADKHQDKTAEEQTQQLSPKQGKLAQEQMLDKHDEPKQQVSDKQDVPAQEETQQVSGNQDEPVQEQKQQVRDNQDEPAEKEVQQVSDKHGEPAQAQTEQVPDNQDEPAQGETQQVSDKHDEPTLEQTQQVSDKQGEPTLEQTQQEADKQDEPAQEQTQQVSDKQDEPAQEQTQQVSDKQDEPAQEQTQQVSDKQEIVQNEIDDKPAQEQTQQVSDTEFTSSSTNDLKATKDIEPNTSGKMEMVHDNVGMNQTESFASLASPPPPPANGPKSGRLSDDPTPSNTKEMTIQLDNNKHAENTSKTAPINTEKVSKLTPDVSGTTSNEPSSQSERKTVKPAPVDSAQPSDKSCCTIM